LRGYLIFELEITDQQAWEEYRRAAGPIMEQSGGTFLVRSERVEPLEGGWKPASISVVEFPSYEAAREFYNSDAYQGTVALRQKASRGRGILVGSTPVPGGNPQ
jgi:uncharacterized protein (DUF1330 family)